MAENESLQSIHDFFAALDTGEEASEEEYEIDYASSGVVKKGLEVIEMLMRIQKIVGDSGAPDKSESKTPDLNDPMLEMVSKVKHEAVARALKENEREADRLMTANMDLEEANRNLKEKIKAFEDKVFKLQKQVERLYHKSEMQSILDRLEPKPKAKTDEESVPEDVETKDRETDKIQTEPAKDEASKDKGESADEIASDEDDGAEEADLTRDESVESEKKDEELLGQSEKEK